MASLPCCILEGPPPRGPRPTQPVGFLETLEPLPALPRNDSPAAPSAQSAGQKVAPGLRDSGASPSLIFGQR